MDIQSSDGRGMLLKYVTSYVTKMKDHNIFQGLILILYFWNIYIKILHTYVLEMATFFYKKIFCDMPCNEKY